MEPLKVKNIAKWLTNYYDFCYDCLGYQEMNKVHHDLCETLQRKRCNSTLILLPRYLFKSCVVTQGYALWRLIRDTNLRVLIYSDTAGKAQGFLTGIKNHIEGKTGRSKFREYFPSWETDPHKGKWNESQIILSVRTEAQTEPNVDTGGIETSKVGTHYDLIIFDDIVSDLNCNTKEQMDKVYECYQKSLSLLKPGGEVIVIGTRWHFGDTYGRLIADNKTTDEFELFIKSADDEVDGKRIFESCGLTKDFLTIQKRKQGSFIYSCLYLNSPVDEETATFKVSNFKFYGELEKKDHFDKGYYPDLYMTCTVDPAGEGEDFTAITVVGTDAKLQMHVVDIINKHLQTNQIVDEIFRLNYLYQFKKVGIETTFFRGRLKRDVEIRLHEEKVKQNFHPFGIEELQTRWRKGEGKHSRILSLQPWHERGDLLFPGDTFEKLKGDFSTLAYQMIQYPKAPHDDVLDALAWHVNLAQRGGVPKKAGPPRNSPAWLEQKWLRTWEKKQSVYPLRHRRRIKPSFT